MPSLSIVVPAYNEGARLARSLAEVSRYLDARHADAEVVVVDDGSTDDTRGVLAAAASGDPRVVPLAARKNRGKGAAVALGVANARGRAIAFCDADLAYPLDQLDLLLARLSAGADVAVGARDLLPDENRGRYGLARRLATSTFNALVAVSLGIRNGDTQCGMKAFRRDAARALFGALTIERFGFDVELLFLAERWGYRVDRVPVRMRASEASSVRVLRDGLAMAADLARIRLRARRGLYPSRPERTT